MSSNRYSPNSSEFKNLSSRGPPGAPHYHYASPQGKAIRKKQNFDHAMKDERLREEQKQKLESLLNKRGKPEEKPTKPKNRQKQKPKLPMKSIKSTKVQKHELTATYARSRAFKKMAATKAVPSKV